MYPIPGYWILRICSSKKNKNGQIKWNSSKSITFQNITCGFICSSVGNVEIEEVKAYLTANPVFKERERERDGFAYCPHRWCLKMHIRWLKGNAYHRSKTKVFKRAQSFVLMDSFLFQETLSHPLLMPLLEDPKMELKTFLLPLRLGLLTAFHQSAEVNIFTIRVLPPSVSS